MERGFVFDPDHMSVHRARRGARHGRGGGLPGVISSHSWSTQNTLPRVYALGGMVTPYAGGSSGFANAWEEIKSAEVRGELGDQYFGFGYGADANGFGSQGGPRNPAEEVDVDYPFTGIDGAVTFDQQKSGTEAEGKTYDINTDGVDHYGLYPDWLEDLRQIKGDEIVEDMNRGAEAYLQMWERTFGIGEVDCSQWGDEDFNPKGLGTELRLNMKPKRTLRTAGQPVDPLRGTWRWCAGDGGRESDDAVQAAFGKRRQDGLRHLQPARARDRRRRSRRLEEEAEEGRDEDLRRGVDQPHRRQARIRLDRRTAATVTHSGAVSQTAARKLNKLAKRLVRVASS